MSVEDIHFLHQHGEKENKVIFVDSSKRNLYAYPTPSQYVVDFAEPFHNVYGIDILDAAIPRTMYNVDKTNNYLRIGIGTDPRNADIELYLDDRDYNMDTLISELSRLMSSVKNNYRIIVSSAGDGKARLEFTSSVPFMFDMFHSTIAETLGFDQHAVDGSPYYRKLHEVEAVAKAQGRLPNPQLFGSLSTPNLPVSIEVAPLLSNPNTATVFGILNQERQVAQRISMTIYNVDLESGQTLSQQYYLEEIKIQFKIVGNPNLSNLKLRWELQYVDSVSGFPKGEKVYGGDFNNIDLVNMTATISDLAIDDFKIITIETFIEYYLVIFADEMPFSETDYIAVVCNEIPENKRAGAYHRVISNVFPTRGQVIWERLDVNYNFCVIFTTMTKEFYLTAPGILSLVGERFIMLRCPEIEQFLYGSISYGNNSPGLALFKMGVVGYSDSRFDFASIEYKQFHPIGKLARLTFRYERLDGELYDFKGVNHHLLIVVRYHVPKRQHSFSQYRLNPNYNPDFLKFMKTMEQKETSDIEDSDDNNANDKNFRTVYLKREKELASSDSEELEYVPAAPSRNKALPPPPSARVPPTKQRGKVFYKDHRETSSEEDTV
jgi:hypothetical protein